MSRSQETATYDTAKDQNAKNFDTGQKAQQAEAADIGGYKSALGKFAADNPYVQGGEQQTATNAVLADNANASSDAARAGLQDQAVRTGQNPAAANATAATIAEDNTRSLGADQAKATEDRINNEAEYNKGVVSATGAIPGMDNTLAATAGGQGNQQLDTRAQEADKNQSFMDQFGGSLAQGLGRAATSWLQRPKVAGIG